MADVIVDVPSTAHIVGNAIDINTALQEVLKKLLIADDLVHGIHQACKALDKRQAVLCILGETFDEPLHKKVITALCHEHRIPLIHVESHKKLGEWSCLFKIDKESKPRNVCGCSVVVIKDFDEIKTQALDVVKEHLRQNS